MNTITITTHQGTNTMSTALSLYSQASTHAKEVRHYLVVAMGLTILAGMYTRTWCEDVWVALESSPLTNWGLEPTEPTLCATAQPLEQFSDEAIEQWLATAPAPSATAPVPCAYALRTIRSLRAYLPQLEPQPTPLRRPRPRTTVVPAGGDLRA